MFEFLGPPTAISLGLIMWPAVVSFRARRWGQGALLMAAGVLAPLIGFVVAVLVMWEEMQSGLPMGVVAVALFCAWVTAIAAPVAIGIILQLFGRFAPPRADT